MKIDRTRHRLQWHALHSYVVDSVLSQDDPDNVAGLQIVIGGLTSRDFARAVGDGRRVRVRPLREDSGEIAFRVEVRDDQDHWQGLCRPAAHALGISDEEAQDALEKWLHQEDALLPPDPEIEP